MMLNKLLKFKIPFVIFVLSVIGDILKLTVLVINSKKTVVLQMLWTFLFFDK